MMPAEAALHKESQEGWSCPTVAKRIPIEPRKTLGMAKRLAFSIFTCASTVAASIGERNMKEGHLHPESFSVPDAGWKGL